MNYQYNNSIINRYLESSVLSGTNRYLIMICATIAIISVMIKQKKKLIPFFSGHALFSIL